MAASAANDARLYRKGGAILTRLGTRLALAILLVMACSLTRISAQPVCNGTLTPAWTDVCTSPGAGSGGDVGDTEVSDDVYQCLKEAVHGSNSYLSRTSRFANVPAGTQ